MKIYINEDNKIARVVRGSLGESKIDSGLTEIVFDQSLLTGDVFSQIFNYAFENGQFVKVRSNGPLVKS